MIWVVLKIAKLLGQNMDQNILQKNKTLISFDSLKFFASFIGMKLVNFLMRDGKRFLAEKIVLQLFFHLRQKQKDPFEVLAQGITNVMPVIELRPVKMRGIVFKIPTPVTRERSILIALKWLIISAKSRKTSDSFGENLALEFLDAAMREGVAFKKQRHLYEAVISNKTFTNYRWF